MSGERAAFEGLSPAGEARRAMMLRELQEVMARRRVLRVGTRAGTLALIVAAFVAVRVSVTPPTPNRSPSSTPGAAPMMTRMIATDASIAARLSAPPVELRVREVTDTELRNLLAASGLPTGFVRTGGRVLLSTELEPKPTNDNGAPRSSS